MVEGWAVEFGISSLEWGEKTVRKKKGCTSTERLGGRIQEQKNNWTLAGGVRPMI